MNFSNHTSSMYKLVRRLNCRRRNFLGTGLNGLNSLAMNFGPLDISSHRTLSSYRTPAFGTQTTTKYSYRTLLIQNYPHAHAATAVSGITNYP